MYRVTYLIVLFYPSTCIDSCFVQDKLVVVVSTSATLAKTTLVVCASGASTQATSSFTNGYEHMKDNDRFKPYSNSCSSTVHYDLN